MAVGAVGRASGGGGHDRTGVGGRHGRGGRVVRRRRRRSGERRTGSQQGSRGLVERQDDALLERHARKLVGGGSARSGVEEEVGRLSSAHGKFVSHSGGREGVVSARSDGTLGGQIRP